MNLQNLSLEERVIKKAAISAGEVILKGFYKEVKVEYKSNKSLLTKTDKKAEEVIIGTIKKSFKDHDILSEESKPKRKGSPWRWIMDPLDGTTNFAHKYPCFCVSIALEYKGEVKLGIVYDPLRKEMFFARKGKGAYLNNKKIKVSKIKSMEESLLLMGFPYDIKKNPDENVPYFKEFLLRSQAVRRDGAAALDICYVACGRVDGFFERKLFPWDVAAGLLVLRESGGRATDMFGKESTIWDRSVVATNDLIHNNMLETLNKVTRSERKK